MDLKDIFNTMKRTLKAKIRKAKRNYEIKEAREEKVKVKGFFSFIYKNFERNILTAQNSYITNREYRSKRNDLKLFNNQIGHLVAVKKGIFRRIRRETVDLKDCFNTMKRTFKAEISKAKRDYEIKVAREAKVNVKGFFQL